MLPKAEGKANLRFEIYCKHKTISQIAISQFILQLAINPSKQSQHLALIIVMPNNLAMLFDRIAK